MMRSFVFLTICFTLLVSLSFAQEICNNNLDDDGDGLVDCLDGECGSKVCEICDNGVDDDGDRFIDCYDKECSLNASCDGFFLGKENCAVPPDDPRPVQLKLKYKSSTGVANHVSQLRIGDVDSDGIPEIVTTYRNADNATVSALNILQAPSSTGFKLNVDKSINMLANGDKVSTDDFAIADIDKDGCAEVFAITTVTDGSGYKIIGYNACTGARLWAAPISFTTFPGTIGLADFNGDGDVELYVRTAIYNAHTGVLLGENNIDNDNTGINFNVNKGRGMNSNGSIAADVDPIPGLELVAGCRIYSVQINKAAQTATLNMVRQRPEYATRTGRTSGSATSVADFNQDGTLDVLAVGSLNGYDLTTTIFFWDLRSNALKTFTDLSGTGPYLNGWKNGAGRINIADVDGDTLLNAVFVSGKYMYALKEGATNLDTLWREQVIEETSGYTGCTVFDLNGDGRSEIIYRDEDYLYVFGTDADGVLVKSPPIRCASRTFHEYPVVADMDGDGTTEICVTCAVDETVTGRNHNLYDDAEVRVYESANAPWLPARKVWNQHGYFNVNVNDDLTIPTQQQSSHLIYAKGAPCRKNGTSRPLNSFMNQGAFLNALGCPLYPNPDFVIVPVSANKLIEYTPFTCAADSFQVKFKFMNQGVLSFSNQLQISFYKGDPRQLTPLATHLDTKPMSLSGMNPGDTITTTVTLKNTGDAFDLYIVLNDDGSTLPLDISQQFDPIVECGYDNVFNTHIEPTLVSISSTLLSGNFTCLTAPGVPAKPDNGAIEAYVSLGEVKDNTNFNFYWSLGATAKPAASVDYVGPVFQGLPTGIYTVYAMQKNTSCASDTISVVVHEVPSSVDAKVIVENELDDAENPNGALRVVVNDLDNDGTGDPETNFDYAWYSGNEILVEDTLATGAIIDQLGAGTYSVLVFENATGCYDSASIELKNTNPSACPAKPDFTPVSFNDEKPVDYDPFHCATESFELRFKIKNQGGVSFSNTFQVTFYNGDPRQSSPLATRLNTVSMSALDMNPGDEVTSTALVNNPGAAFDLYIVINDDGTTLPLDIAAQSDHVVECDYDNIISARIEPDPVRVAPELLHENFICSTAPGLSTRPHNGEVKAYVELGTLQDNSNFNFYWSIGSTAKPIASVDHVGSVFTGLTSGSYTVYAVHKTLACHSDTTVIVVDDVILSVDAKVVVESELTDYDHPNGALKVIVNDADNNGIGDPEGDFDYAWYKGKEVPGDEVISTSHIITGLNAGAYSVLVFDQTTGCYDSASATFRYNRVLSAEQGADVRGVSMYPNPGADGFTVMIENGYIGNVQVQLNSALGNEVYRSFTSHKGTGTLTIPVDANRLRSGVYLVKITLGKETVYQKWVKR